MFINYNITIEHLNNNQTRNYHPSNSSTKRLSYYPNMDTVPSSQSITVKIVAMIILIFIDIILNSFVEPSFNNSFQGKFDINYYFVPIQILVTIMIFIMMLIMMWQTFPLRYGLIGMILQEFKWTFLLVLAFIGMHFVIERGMKLSGAVNDKNDFKQVAMWSNGGYVFLYYFRFLLYPIFYGFAINFCFRIIDPTFYRPNRWLK